MLKNNTVVESIVLPCDKEGFQQEIIRKREKDLWCILTHSWI